MDCRKEFVVEPGSRVKLSKIDPAYTGKHLSHKRAESATAKHCHELGKLQYLMYAEGKRSLLIVLQAMDAGGKDGTVRHVVGAMNPQSTTVTPFKQPTPPEIKHDFLWRVHPHVPARGVVAVFNRSHYEDVLVVRVHKLVPKEIWSQRYDVINNFERLLRRENETHILKFFLHISPEEQLERFRERMVDPAHNWKISEDDYKEREYWDDYVEAYEDVFAKTSTEEAPWYVIPANHKWFRNLAVSQIIAETMEELGMKMPRPQVDLDLIRKKYHRAAEQAGGAISDDKHKKKSKKAKT
jgi:PPK2 family polyphosphate:nucleotide phosphotransferase